MGAEGWYTAWRGAGSRLGRKTWQLLSLRGCLNFPEAHLHRRPRPQHPTLRHYRHQEALETSTGSAPEPSGSDCLASWPPRPAPLFYRGKSRQPSLGVPLALLLAPTARTASGPGRVGRRARWEADDQGPTGPRDTDSRPLQPGGVVSASTARCLTSPSMQGYRPAGVRAPRLSDLVLLISLCCRASHRPQGDEVVPPPGAGAQDPQSPPAPPHHDPASSGPSRVYGRGSSRPGGGSHDHRSDLPRPKVAQARRRGAPGLCLGAGRCESNDGALQTTWLQGPGWRDTGWTSWPAGRAEEPVPLPVATCTAATCARTGAGEARRGPALTRGRRRGG